MVFSYIMDYSNCCRLCLGQNDQMRHIHASITISGENVRLSSILVKFYDYQVPEDLEAPENICINCVHHLTLTQAFKNRIEDSAQILAENASRLESNSDFGNDFDCDSDSDYKPEKYITANEIETYEPKALPRIYKISPLVQFKETTRRRLSVKATEGPEKQLFCVECKSEFRTTISLRNHCKSCHSPKNLTGRDCEFCYEKFEDYKDLVIHRKLHLRPYLCLTCWNGFFEESEFTEHKCEPNHSRRSKITEKVLRQCDQCGKSYPPGYIKVHMMTHGSELKYSCKYCPKKFKVPNGLNSHVLWNHKRTRDHKCDVCGSSFISASAKSTHIRKNHLKEKKYGCENCSKRFFSKSELQRHTLTHTGVKNFHCHLCDKSYQTRYGLNVHLKSHAQINEHILSS